MCGTGKHQSPIDVTSFDVFEDPTLTPLQLNWHQGTANVFFNGETCQIAIEKQSPSVTGGPLGNDIFYMVQFHTHEVSEHHIDGIAYPLEIHFVHKNSAGNLAVVGFFFRVTQTNSSFIGEFVDFCKVNSSMDRGLDFKLLLDFPNVDSIPYYTYSGSLTTPPCTENVTWILISQIFTVSRIQLNEFMAILPHNLANNRPIQAINDRVIRYFSGVKYVDEIGTSYELCEREDLITCVEKQFNWNNMTLSLGFLPPDETIYGVFHVSTSPMINIKYVRITFDGLSHNSVLVRMRQVHISSTIQTKNQFFSMSRSQRQQFYQNWLPGNEPHDGTDITYPPELTVSMCSNDFYCGYILNKPQLTDQTDVLPVFIFSVTNIGPNALTGDTKISAYAGDRSPNCRIAPVGIILGSIWTAMVIFIIALTVSLLTWEKTILARQQRL